MSQQTSYFAETTLCWVHLHSTRPDSCSLLQSLWDPELEIRQQELEDELKNGGGAWIDAKIQSTVNTASQ